MEPEVSISIGTRNATMTYQSVEEIGLTYRIRVTGSTRLTAFCDKETLIEAIHEHMGYKPSKLANLEPIDHFEFSINPDRVPNKACKLLVLLTAAQGCEFEAPDQCQ